jgi:hypothetical protein
MRVSSYKKSEIIFISKRTEIIFYLRLFFYQKELRLFFYLRLFFLSEIFLSEIFLSEKENSKEFSLTVSLNLI